MQDLHNRISGWLRNQKDRPHSYLIDAPFDIDQDVPTIRQHYRIYPDLSNKKAWSSCFFAILRLAVEAGYQYEGTGTQYWGKLEDMLAAELSETSKNQLILWFQQLTDQTGYIVGKSDWDNRYTRITWPISHAVIPKQLHRQLLESMMNYPYPINQTTADFLLVDFFQRYATQNGSLALQRFVEKSNIVTDLIHAILNTGRPSQTLSATFLARIAQDIVEAPQTQKTYKRLRQKQVQLRISGRKLLDPSTLMAEAKTRLVKNLNAMLTLSTKDLQSGKAALSLRPPTLPKNLFSLASQSHERAKLTLGGSIPIRSFFGGAHKIYHDIAQHTGEQISIFKRESLSNTEAQLYLWLRAYRIDLQLPIVFKGDCDAEAAQLIQVVSSSFRDDGVYTILHKRQLDDPQIAGVEARGQLHNLSCWKVDTSVAQANAWLASQGGCLLTTPQASIVAKPTFIGRSSYEQGGLYEDEPIFIHYQGHPSEVTVDHHTQVYSDGIYKINKATNIRLGHAEQSITRWTSGKAVARCITIENIGGSALKSTLEQGLFTLQFDAPVRLYNLPVSISMRANKHSTILKSMVQSIPQLPYDVLLPAEWAASLPSSFAHIEVRVGGVAHRIFDTNPTANSTSCTRIIHETTRHPGPYGSGMYLEQAGTSNNHGWFWPDLRRPANIQCKGTIGRNHITTSQYRRTTDQLLPAITEYLCWQHAQIAPLSPEDRRRNEICAHRMREIVAILCGKKWMQAEVNLLQPNKQCIDYIVDANGLEICEASPTEEQEIKIAVGDFLQQHLQQLIRLSLLDEDELYDTLEEKYGEPLKQLHTSIFTRDIDSDAFDPVDGMDSEGLDQFQEFFAPWNLNLYSIGRLLPCKVALLLQDLYQENEGLLDNWTLFRNLLWDELPGNSPNDMQLEFLFRLWNQPTQLQHYQIEDILNILSFWLTTPITARILRFVTLVKQHIWDQEHGENP